MKADGNKINDVIKEFEFSYQKTKLKILTWDSKISLISLDFIDKK